jgi:hypothetical protein
MNLNSSSPFWRVKNGFMNVFPRLLENVQCDVLVVGAGITARSSPIKWRPPA